MKADSNTTCVLRMAMGAIEERCNYEMSKVVDNILDINTKPTAKRKIQITLELIPDSERQHISLSAAVKTTLAPTEPVATALYVGNDSNGELVVAEMVPHIPGQLNMAGEEQASPKILKLVSQQ